jgi:hypothetical protein
MKHLLSIDMDYFVNCGAGTKEAYFPGENPDQFPAAAQRQLWSRAYSLPGSPLRKIGIHRKSFNLIKDLCRSHEGGVMIAESHAHAYSYFLGRTEPGERFTCCNIDFHHDLYGQADYPAAGNWARLLLRERPEMAYLWIGQADSQAECLLPHTNTAQQTPLSFLEPFQNRESAFDCIFLCRSDLCYPPHLDKYFYQLTAALTSGGKGRALWPEGTPEPRELPETAADFPASEGI